MSVFSLQIYFRIYEFDTINTIQKLSNKKLIFKNEAFDVAKKLVVLYNTLPNMIETFRNMLFNTAYALF